MAKKKKIQTPKDDLIESLMNDVQEIGDLTTQHGNIGVHEVYLDEESRGVRNDQEFLVNHNEDENRVDDANSAFENLWQKVKEPEASESPLELDQVPNLEEFQNSSIESSRIYPRQEEDFGGHGFDEKTLNIQNHEDSQDSDQGPDADKTVAVAGYANRQPHLQKNIAPKVTFGSARDPRSVGGAGGGSVYASNDAILAQSESLKIAQKRILELEKELEKYRQENEELASAGEIIRNRSEELSSRFLAVEKEKQEISDSLLNELSIVKGTLIYKETEATKARLKIEELEARLKSDFKKIRVRERELENRLELVKAEKTALLRAKDENILELKRKIDHLQSELDNYRIKVLELNKTIGLNQEQFKRTVRALRLALSNLEVKEESIVPLKKAE